MDVLPKHFLDQMGEFVNVQVGQKEFTLQYTSWSYSNVMFELINHRFLRRKYELEEKHVYKLCDKQIKNCSTQLKRQLRKISTVNGILITADVN